MEPDRKNFKKLTKYISEKDHIYAYNNAAWCIDTQLPFSSKSGRQSSLASMGTKYIESKSVDNMLDGKEATLIKMDVEGAECKAYILDLTYVQAKEVQKYPHFYGIKQP